jgi:hypothetical protein
MDEADIATVVDTIGLWLEEQLRNAIRRVVKSDFRNRFSITIGPSMFSYHNNTCHAKLATRDEHEDPITAPKATAEVIDYLSRVLALYQSDEDKAVGTLPASAIGAAMTSHWKG